MPIEGYLRHGKCCDRIDKLRALFKLLESKNDFSSKDTLVEHMVLVQNLEREAMDVCIDKHILTTTQAKEESKREALKELDGYLEKMK